MNLVAPADLMFLLLENSHSPMHVAGLSIYTPPENASQTFVADLVTRWKTYRKARPPFNRRPALHMGLWFWEEDPQFDLDCHIQHLALPKPGRMSDLCDMVARLHGNLLDRHRPLWEACIIEGLPGGRFACYVKIHHALVDGITGSRMMAQNLSSSPDEQKAPIWAYQFPQPPQPHEDHSEQLHTRLASEIGAALSTGKEVIPGILSGVWDILRPAPAGTGEVLPLQAPATPLNVAISNLRSFAAQPFSLQRLKKLGHAAGATVNDIALAMCAGALRKYLLSQHKLPKRSLTAMVPVSLHAEDAHGGNQIGLLLASLATNIANPRKRLETIVKSTQAAKQHLQTMSRLEKWAYIVPMVALAAPLMVTGDARRHPLFNVIISNVPGPTATLYLDGARLDEVYPVSIPADYLGLNITITGYGDTLGFGYIACRRVMPALQHLLDYTDESLIELEHVLLDKLVRPARPVRAAKPAAERNITSRVTPGKTKPRKPAKEIASPINSQAEQAQKKMAPRRSPK
ncbi:WS/DGAT/MGAT family O-acyltransferase [Pseudomonas sp. N040]|uniref:WS/DGAT/MGAT family O-acyltransferase n=1 Tax=Pseudomonas sp. N040 TaxID=2785325 RepID=UPI0018A287BD|nr:wax ester/triacylglycerol synthase family O-acyltransferase [Pseudomonas sp. N040]MBF7731526.1 wax ester/triacylglycerol synthase family O-acyltransferase [Pseudomonas sp. N040]MBW7015170.1 wax ester/triacylglycerol synthase family O-acyltransferase [Pseudomonas sp. N040]